MTVTCPKLAEIQGIRFDVSCGRAADVYVDVTANGGAERARDEVDRETERVSRDLQISSDLRFRVYYLGSTRAFTSAVSWLGRGFSAGPTVRETEAVYLDLPDFIAIDQSQMAQFRTENALRHELVHRSLRHFVGYANIDEVPSWLNEGWAFLKESESGRLHTEARVASASSAFFGRLPSLDTLSDLGDWNSRTGLDHIYQYYVSAQATQFLIDDMTLPGLLRALKMVGEGEPFTHGADTGRPRIRLHLVHAALQRSREGARSGVPRDRRRAWLARRDGQHGDRLRPKARRAGDRQDSRASRARVLRQRRRLRRLREVPRHGMAGRPISRDRRSRGPAAPSERNALGGPGHRGRRVGASDLRRHLRTTSAGQPLPALRQVAQGSPEVLPTLRSGARVTSTVRRADRVSPRFTVFPHRPRPANEATG